MILESLSQDKEFKTAKQKMKMIVRKRKVPSKMKKNQHEKAEKETALKRKRMIDVLKRKLKSKKGTMFLQNHQKEQKGRRIR